MTDKQIGGAIRRQIQWDFEDLPKDQRRILTAAFKRERQNNPTTDWPTWLFRTLAPTIVNGMTDDAS
jgi:hypothetical protein